MLSTCLEITTTIGWCLVGIAGGLVFCRGAKGTSELVSKAKSFVESSGCANVNRNHFGLVLSLLLSAGLVWFGAVRVACPTENFPPHVKASALTMLVVALFSEISSVISSVSDLLARRAQLGERDQQLLCACEFPSMKMLWADCLMCVVYIVLIFFYGLMFSGEVLCCHQDPYLKRPVATARYIEWSIAVPILMWIVGRILLEHETEVVLTPIFQTISYLWLAWAGLVVEEHGWRALLISSCFTIYFEAALCQIAWSQWESKRSESFLNLSQCIIFGIYGVVYLLALSDWLSAEKEEYFYSLMDLTVKIFHTGIFALLRRAKEVNVFFGSLRSYLDIMLGMRSLVGAQFDLVINCRMTSAGLVIASTSMVLDDSIGKPLLDRPLDDICFNREDVVRVRKWGRNRRNQRSEISSTVPWDRQEALHQVADLLRLEIFWAESPTGSTPAEIFVAGCEGKIQDGDIVLIGVKILQLNMIDQVDADAMENDTISECSDFARPYQAGRKISLIENTPKTSAPESNIKSVNDEDTRKQSLLESTNTSVQNEKDDMQQPLSSVKAKPETPDLDHDPTGKNPKLTELLISEQSEKNGRQNLARVPRSCASTRSIDQRSVRSVALSPVREDDTNPSSSDKSAVHDGTLATDRDKKTVEAQARQLPHNRDLPSSTKKEIIEASNSGRSMRKPRCASLYASSSTQEPEADDLASRHSSFRFS